MAEYTFKITFTDKGKKFTATSVIEHRMGPADLNEMLIVVFKDIFSKHPTANNIHWELL